MRWMAVPVVALSVAHGVPNGAGSAVNPLAVF